MESELDYVNDLYLCRSAYIRPLSVHFDVSQIFINWDQLIQVHETNLEKFSTPSLTNERDRYSFVLGTYQDLISSLVQLYIDFCSQQNEASRRFEARLQSDIRFRQLVDECQRNLAKLLEQKLISGSTASGDGADSSVRISRNSKLPLTSFLLKPMQRITKYSLIFERILKSIRESGDVHRLDELASGLKASAQMLCKQVNEACRFKEDLEDNNRRLQWAQKHIKQVTGYQSEAPYEHRYSLTTTPDLRFPNGRESTNEYIIFDSNTNHMGERRLIKAGSLFKRSSSKEIVAFLFNDLLLMTLVRGVGSHLRVADVFQSERAQQSYYKLYKAPILLDNLVMRTSSQQQSNRSSWAEQQLLEVNFGDQSTGSAYSLLAINAQEKVKWLSLLSECSSQAQRMLAQRQALQGSLTRPMRKPSIADCHGRLFVTVLELNNIEHNMIILQRVSNTHLRSRDDVELTLRVCVKIQMKRFKVITEDLFEEKKEIVPISDIFKTAIVNVNLDNRQMSRLVDCDLSTLADEPVFFNEESTQFLLENKARQDESDYIDIKLYNEFIFRETQLLAKQRLNMDHLVKKLPLDRPVELTFKLKPIPTENGNHQLTLEKKQNNLDIIVKLRFHLQLF